MSTYTVIGMRADAARKDDIRAATFVQTVEAPTPTLAAREARRRMTAGSPGGIEIIAVLEGRHADVYEPILDTEEYERSIQQEER